MKNILTFFLIFAGIFANARNITGIVLSDNDSTEVVGATCKLMSDGHIITVSTTGNNGEFELATDLKTKLERQKYLCNTQKCNFTITIG